MIRTESPAGAQTDEDVEAIRYAKAFGVQVVARDITVDAPADDQEA